MQKRHNIVFLCFCAAFICYIDRVNISVAIIPMQEAFGWSDTTKGFVLSSFFIGYMILQAPSGWLANRIGGKLVLGFAVLSWSIFTILTPVAAMISLPLLIAVRIAMGLGESAMFPASFSLFSRWVPESERSRSMGLLASGIPLGTLFALTTTGWIVTRYGWPSVFYIFGLFGVIWAAFWYFKAASYPAEYPGITDEELELLGGSADGKQEPADIPWKKLLTHRAVLVIFVNHFCTNWGLYMMLAWLPSYFRDVQSLSVTGAGFYSAAPWLTMFVMTNVAGWAADRLLKRGNSITFVRKLMQVGGLFGSAVFFLLALHADTPLVALSVMCGALAFIALTFSGYVPNFLDIAPRYADVLIGISNTFATIPGIIGVALAGWLLDQTGSYAGVFLIVAAVQVVGGALWLLFATGEKIID